MDYATKPTSRKVLRAIAKLIREQVYNLSNEAPFPVLQALEQIHIIFPGTYYVIVEDDELPYNTPARCTPDEDGNFKIEITNYVYKGAYEKNIGAYLGFICHEICHVFLYNLGFTPIFERSFVNNALPPFRSVEWQTKALTGEVMMPYEATMFLTEKEIEETYCVSRGFAKKRKTYH